eukprot:1176329-Prorocentrum_minimum.AAC.2
MGEQIGGQGEGQRGATQHTCCDITCTCRLAKEVLRVRAERAFIGVGPSPGSSPDTHQMTTSIPSHACNHAQQTVKPLPSNSTPDL